MPVVREKGVGARAKIVSARGVLAKFLFLGMRRLALTQALNSP
jgi:hypothetical protein